MAYGQRGDTGFNIPQARAGAFASTPTMQPQAAPQSAQPAFQLPAQQPAQQVQPQAAPKPVAAPQFATSQNVMAQNLPQTGGMGVATPQMQQGNGVFGNAPAGMPQVPKGMTGHMVSIPGQPQADGWQWDWQDPAAKAKYESDMAAWQATQPKVGLGDIIKGIQPLAATQPAAAKPQYDPYMLVNTLFGYAPQSANPIALRGGGVMNTMRGGYNLDDVRTAALKDPNAFLSSLKNAYSSPDQSWNNYTSILGDTKEGSGNGFATIAGAAPDFLREMIKGYDKPAETPKAATPADTPKATTQNPLDAEQQQMDDYYNQITKGYQDQISGYQNALNSLNSYISQLGNSGGDSLSQAVEPQSLPVVRPYEMARPNDLGDFLNGLSDVQQRTALATRATQGQGLSDEDTNYFLNMIARNLIGDNGKMGNLEDLTPIELQYLSQLGMPTADEQGFLKALKGRGIYSA